MSTYYCNELEHLFINNHLISYLDYHYDAKSYYGGFIHIQFFLFTSQAEKLEEHVKQLSPTFDDQTIQLASMEIMAEKQAKLEGDFSKVAGLLEVLHEKPWQEVEEFGSWCTSDFRRSSKGLTLYDVPGSYFRTMVCTASLASMTELVREMAWPLFYVLAQSLLNNITLELGRERAYFGYDRVWKFSVSTTMHVVKYRISKRQTKQLTIEADKCEELLQRILRDGYVEKILDYLGNATYKRTSRAPDELQFYEISSLLVGAAGWREIATRKNIQAILKNVTISLTMSKESHKIAMGSMMN